MKGHQGLIPLSHDHHLSLILAQRLEESCSRAPKSEWPEKGDLGGPSKTARATERPSREAQNGSSRTMGEPFAPFRTCLGGKHSKRERIFLGCLQWDVSEDQLIECGKQIENCFLTSSKNRIGPMPPLNASESDGRFS